MNTEIDSLKLEDLEKAVGTVRATADAYNEKRKTMQVSAQNKDHRFHKMGFQIKLPKINPLFEQLQNELETELKRRTGVKS